MSEPHHTDPRPNRPSRDPNLRPSSAPMWVWVAGIAVVVVIAFSLAAGWNSNTQTAVNAPPAAIGGSGGMTMPPSTTTGSGATGAGTTDGAPAARPNAPAMTPDRPVPSSVPNSSTN